LGDNFLQYRARKKVEELRSMINLFQTSKILILKDDLVVIDSIKYQYKEMYKRLDLILEIEIVNKEEAQELLNNSL